MKQKYMQHEVASRSDHKENTRKYRLEEISENNEERKGEGGGTNRIKNQTLSRSV